MRPWIHADYVLGFLLGIALGLMAIDTGRRCVASSPSPPPSAPTLTHYPGP